MIGTGLSTTLRTAAAPGMVMRPEPWGEAWTASPCLVRARYRLPPRQPANLIVPTPSGAPFTQQTATELADRDHLIFACGRYEGIDSRVVDYAATRMQVAELSIGDYVLAGGEVAALVIIEAVVRLLPGVLGNPESLTEESHSGGPGMVAGISELHQTAQLARPRRARDLVQR